MIEVKLIDANALDEIVSETTWYHINKNGELVEGAEDSDSALYKAEDIYRIINNAPTVAQFNIFCENADEKAVEDMKVELRNVLKEERPKGKWNYIQAGMAVCPFCGASPHKEYKDFCAKCGADLGEQK